MASKAQKPVTDPKIVVTETVSLVLALHTSIPSHIPGFAPVHSTYHQPDFAVLEDFVEQVQDYYGHDAARSLVDLNITNSGITATVRTEK